MLFCLLIRIIRSHDFGNGCYAVRTILFYGGTRATCFLFVLGPMGDLWGGRCFAAFSVLFALPIQLLFYVLFGMYSFVGSGVLYMAIPVEVKVGVPTTE